MEAAAPGPAGSIDAPFDAPPAVSRGGGDRPAGGSSRPTGTDTPAPVVVDPEGKPFSAPLHAALVVGTVVVLVAGLALRFWTTSDLWLDEALTVNIAKLPVHEIPSYLRRDGAPPLFYLLLHYWMSVFGSSDVAVRALPGVFGVATLPLVWLAGRRLGGRTAAWAATLLIASSPFAVRYDTETRMYSLVALLTVCGFLALDRTLRRPRPGNLIAVAAVTGLLLYSHYWSIYLVGTMVLWLAYQSWRGRPEWRRSARAALAAMVVGCLTFLPWVPIFLYQSKHTGTPWSTPANFAAMVNAISSFAGGGTSEGRGLALLYFALAGLGLFGLATDRLHIDLDIRTRTRGRPLAIAFAGTLVAAITGGFISNSAFDARYASVVFVPLLLLVALGLTVFCDRHIRVAILALAVVLGFVSAVPNVTTNRTQAGEVSAAIGTSGRPGDVVAYCPDQLGPAVDRLLPSGRYQQITFPRETGPAYVNWVDYGAAVGAASPISFAQKVEAMAAGGHQIFVVWSPGYQTYGLKCETIVQALAANSSYQVTDLVTWNSVSFYQPMALVRLTPHRS